MSWPRAWYYVHDVDGKPLMRDGERIVASVFRVNGYDSQRDILKVTDRFLVDNVYKKVILDLPVSQVYALNWEAHESLGGVLRGRVPCLAHGYGADAKTSS